jgi:hypothetical protein
MTNTAVQVRDYFAAGGHILVGQARPPERIAVRQIGTAYLATLRYGAQAIRAVVKPVAPDSWLHDPTLLYHVHYRLQNADPLLRRVLNTMVAPIPERGWVVVEYVAGVSLRDALCHALRFPVYRDAQPSTLLAQTARALAALNRISAAQVRVPLAPQANLSYVETLERCWADRRVQPYLPRTWRAGPPANIMGDSFRCRGLGQGRLADRILPIDCQPKNILVPCRGEVRFIDQDYGVGNPALGLAFFLLTLDRLGLAHPLPYQRARIAAWKAVFLESYFQHAEPWIAEDLPFFYAWTLVRQVCDAAARRLLFRPYARWHYARCLREFLSACEARPVSLSHGIGAAPLAPLGTIGEMRKAA